MAKKSVHLLLLENVENLGIVGDLVKVTPGFARNYLVPMGLAETPTDEKIEALKEARAAARAEYDKLRDARRSIIERLEEVELHMSRSANDLGALYGSVTQRDIADALNESGYEVDIRAIRIKAAFKRTGNYSVPIQFDKELRTEINLVITSDRPIDEMENDMEFDDEGELIERDTPAAKEPQQESVPTTVAAGSDD